MKKILMLVALAVASLPLLAVSNLTYADSPGQLAENPNNYEVKNVTQNGVYTNSISTSCNDTIKYSILFSNIEFGILDNLTAQANMSTGVLGGYATNSIGKRTSISGKVNVTLPSNGSLKYITGTTYRISSDGATKTQKDDTITTGGVNVGSLGGSTETFVQFEAKVNCEQPPKPPTQSLVCSALDLTVLNKEKRQVKATVAGKTTNGATITGYSINFGDGTVVNKQTSEHTYAKDGGYVVTGYVSGTVNGKTETVSASSCMKTVAFNAPEPPIPPQPPTPPTPPTPPAPEQPSVVPSELPNTGAEGLALATAGASGLGAAGYQLYLRRRK